MCIRYRKRSVPAVKIIFPVKLLFYSWSLLVNKVVVAWKGFNPHLMITRGSGKVGKWRLLLIEKLTQRQQGKQNTSERRGE